MSDVQASLNKLLSLEWLYNFETTNKNIYSDKATNKLDYNKLPKTAKCWIQPGAEREAKKKTLIVHDIFSRVWNNRYHENICECLTALMEAGFEIYDVGADGGLLRLTVENIQDKNNFKQKIPLTHDDIYKRAFKDLNKSKEDIAIISHPQANDLLSSIDYIYAPVVNSTIPYELFMNLVNTGLKDPLHHLLKDKINNINDTVYSFSNTDSITIGPEDRMLDLQHIQLNMGAEASEIANQLGHIKNLLAAKPKTKMMSLGIKNMTTISNEDVTTIQELLADIQFSLTQFYKCDATAVLTLLSKMQPPTQIILRSCSKWNASEELPMNFLQNVKKLSIIYCQKGITGTATVGNGLNNILLNTPELEILNLSESIDLDGLNFPPGFKLHNLRELRCVKSTINAATLQQLLEVAPNLEVLDITDIGGDLSNLNLSAACSLNKLKKIIAFSAHLTTGTLTTILAKAPNVEILNVAENKLEANTVANENLHLEKITDLNISNLARNGWDVNLCLDACKNSPAIKKLNMEASENVNIPPELKLDQLENLKLNCDPRYDECAIEILKRSPNITQLACTSTVSIKVLNTILQNSNCLRELMLSFNTNSSIPGSGNTAYQEQVTPGLSMPSLEKLNLSPTNQLSERQFSDLLNATPNINELSITGMPLKSEHETVNLDHQALSKLKILNAIDIENNLLNKLLSNATAIKELNLGEIVEVFDAQSELVQLNNLESMTFNVFSLDANVVNYYTMKAPNIKKLVINCVETGNVGLSDDLRLDQLEYLEISFTESKDDFVTSLYNLLKRTPNLKYLKIQSNTTKTSFALPEDLNSLLAVDFKNIILDNDSSMKLHNNENILFNNTQVDLKNNKASSEYIGGELKPKLTTDLNTDKSVKQKFKLESLFRDKNGNFPPPNNYRINVYDNIQDSELKFTKTQKPFVLETIAPQVFSNAKIKNFVEFATYSLDATFASMSETKAGARLYQAKVERNLTQEWQPLPSLAPNETIRNFSIAGLHPNEYTLTYSERDNQYYIRLKEHVAARNCKIEYIFSIPPEKPKLKDKNLQQLVNEYYNSNNTTLELPDGKTEGTVAEWLTALRNSKAGACRHKSLGFFSELIQNRKYNNYKCRIIENDCHRFVEVLEPGSKQWVTCDLGGYDVDLDIKNDRFTAKQADATTAAVSATTMRVQKSSPKINPVFAAPKPKQDRRPAKIYVLGEVFAEARLHRNMLFELDGSAAVDEFQKLIRQTAVDTQHPVFYIDSPDEIPSLKHWLSREAADIKINSGFGGTFRSFLDQNQANTNLPPIVLVNWDNFKSDDLVKFNSLMDTQRKLDQTPIEQQFTLIGVHNRNNTTDSAFYSRFNKIAQPRYLAEQLQAKPAAAAAAAAAVGEPIYLHNSSDWSSLLCGTPQFNGEELSFVAKRIINALETGTALTIVDPPLKDRSFQVFMSRLAIEKSVEIAGKTYAVKPGFALHISDQTFDLKAEATTQVSFNLITAAEDLPANVITLNPTTVSKFFGQIELVGERLRSVPGILAQAPHPSQITVYLSDPLNRSNWGLLVEQAKQHQVKLNIIYKSDLDLPIEFKDFAKPVLAKPVLPAQLFLNVYETNNSSATIKQLTSTKPAPLVIDCTDYSVADLFDAITRKNEDDIYAFINKEGVVNKRLQAGKKVILKGKFSAEMRQHLSEFALANPQLAANLSLVTEQPLPEFKYISNNYQVIRTEPPQPIKNPEVKEPASEDCIATRNQLLQNSMASKIPITLLTGHTGGGKSTHIHDHFANEDNINLFTGLKQLAQWAREPLEGQYNVLFLDEYNISAEQKLEFTEFAAMLDNDPPQIIIDGEVITLGPRHKIIFAGNPYSYGGERHQPQLLEKYPHNVVVFDALPNKYLYTTAIVPILASLNLSEDQQQAVGQQLLKLYTDLKNYPSENPLVTPRELKSMAWLFAAHYQAGANIEILAKQCAITVATHLAPAHWLDTWCKNNAWDNLASLTLEPPTPIQHFCVTESRKPIVARVCEFLQKRAHKKLQPYDRKLIGELGAIVLEGAAGTGKSRIVETSLQANGFKLKQYKSGDPLEPDANHYYQLSVDMSFDDKQELLLHAFNEGAVVIIDEINSTPAMESLLNDLLSGKYKGEFAKHPGFLLIATQNPPIYGGRRILSDAMRHRCLNIQVAEYSHAEMLQVLVEEHKIPAALAEEIVSDYENAQPGRDPPLVFRNLIDARITAMPHIAATLPQRLRAISDPAMIESLLEGLYSNGFLHNNSIQRFYDYVSCLNPIQTQAVCTFMYRHQPELFADEEKLYTELWSWPDALEGYELFRQSLATQNNRPYVALNQQVATEPNNPAATSFYSTYAKVTYPLQALAAALDISLSFIFNTLIVDTLLSFYVLPKKLFTKNPGTLTAEYGAAREKIAVIPKGFDFLIVKPLRFILEEFIGAIVGFVPAALSWGWTKLTTPKETLENVVEKKTTAKPPVVKNVSKATEQKPKPRSKVVNNLIGESSVTKNPTTFYYKALRGLGEEKKQEKVVRVKSKKNSKLKQ